MYLDWSHIFGFIEQRWGLRKKDIAAEYLHCDKAKLSRRPYSKKTVDELYRHVFDFNNEKSVVVQKGETESNLLIVLKDYIVHKNVDDDLHLIWDAEYLAFIREVLSRANLTGQALAQNRAADRSFKERMEQQLRNAELTRYEMVFFAWVCLVRMVPILFCEGNLDFWSEKNRQKYLFSLFEALDMIAAFSRSKHQFFIDLCNGFRVGAAANEAFMVLLAIETPDHPIRIAVDMIRSEIRVGAEDIVYAQYAARISALAFGTAEYEEWILEDIRNIKKKQFCKLSRNNAYSREIWERFESTLEALGCGYWYRLYESILCSGFAFDKEELHSRLHIPHVVKKNGAAAAAQFMESSYTMLDRCCRRES